ncbi:DUF4279 domain-containing protein [Nocardia sp. NPDC058499]|uniref:DUF4279 domain-containing protein n=1 Tax=Nocardia sp. NPDC058499 TaxID=3346530 RepID=UPI0036561A6C
MDHEQGAENLSERFDYSEKPWYLDEISLTLTHPDLDPDRITDLIGVPPSRFARPGTAIQTTEGVWTVDFRCRAELDDELIDILKKIQEYSPRIDQLISFGVKAQISIYGVVRDGSTLRFSNQSLEKLAAIKIPVVLILNANDR